MICRHVYGATEAVSSLLGVHSAQNLPYEDILTHNPIKGSDYYYMVIKDLAALHCV